MINAGPLVSRRGNRRRLPNFQADLVFRATDHQDVGGFYSREKVRREATAFRRWHRRCSYACGASSRREMAMTNFMLFALGLLTIGRFAMAGE
jgi:hypothetical protein